MFSALGACAVRQWDRQSRGPGTQGLTLPFLAPGELLSKLLSASSRAAPPSIVVRLVPPGPSLHGPLTLQVGSASSWAIHRQGRQHRAGSRSSEPRPPPGILPAGTPSPSLCPGPTNTASLSVSRILFLSNVHKRPLSRSLSMEMPLCQQCGNTQGLLWGVDASVCGVCLCVCTSVCVCARVLTCR